MTNKEILFYWIKERYRIRIRKEAGRPKPWTKDHVLQRYRFCNVHREEDTVTKWITKNWRTPYLDDFDLWFAMAVARFINWPETLDRIGYPVPFKQEYTYNLVRSLMAAKRKTWTGAYVVSTNGVKATKPDYIINQLLASLWQHRKALRPQSGQSLSEYAAILTKERGFKGFMTGQVIADLKYVEPLLSATDWSTWAVSGPGSRRGLNRLLDRELRATWKEHEWLEQLSILHGQAKHQFRHIEGLANLHAQDLQNCLCEFDKYLRAVNEEGRPRSKYPGVE